MCIASEQEHSTISIFTTTKHSKKGGLEGRKGLKQNSVLTNGRAERMLLRAVSVCSSILFSGTFNTRTAQIHINH
uniref:Uncharacterized protein n=1 Tax=Anguilla anguilla TaxID=7936 RepID=A0A0E9WS85_ANGAN